MQVLIHHATILTRQQDTLIEVQGHVLVLDKVLLSADGYLPTKALKVFDQTYPDKAPHVIAAEYKDSPQERHYLVLPSKTKVQGYIRDWSYAEDKITFTERIQITN